MTTIVYPTLEEVAQCFNVGVDNINIIGQVDSSIIVLAVVGWIFAIFLFAMAISLTK